MKTVVVDNIVQIERIANALEAVTNSKSGGKVILKSSGIVIEFIVRNK